MKQIYIIKNKLNDKVYIGSSTNAQKRFNKHKHCALTVKKTGKFYDAIRSLGIENFFYEILEEVENSISNEKETEYIIKFDSVEKGYNTKYRERNITRIKNVDPLEIINLYKSGKTLKEIGELYKADKNEISFFLKNYGIKIRDWNKEQSNSLITKEFLEEQLKMKSVKQIALELKLSNTAIRNWMKKFNLKNATPYSDVR